jgi:hypothetical protein
MSLIPRRGVIRRVRCCGYPAVSPVAPNAAPDSRDRKSVALILANWAHSSDHPLTPFGSRSIGCRNRPPNSTTKSRSSVVRHPLRSNSVFMRSTGSHRWRRQLELRSGRVRSLVLLVSGGPYNLPDKFLSPDGYTMNMEFGNPRTPPKRGEELGSFPSPRCGQ